MVNYKRVVCEVAVLAALAALSTAAPLPADCGADYKHYDQRQNGSENYRLNIDGVVIAVAPADSLLAAASDIDFSDLLDLDEFDFDKPSKPPSSNITPLKPPVKPLDLIEPKPEDVKPSDSKPSDSKPDAVKPESPAKPESPLSDVSLNDEPKGEKKDASTRKHENKAQRLKNRIASMLMPLLRRTRHH